jgi:hypothetical protein
VNNQTSWVALIQEMDFSSASFVIKNTTFEGFSQNKLTLILNQKFTNLLSKSMQKNIRRTLEEKFGNLQLLIKTAETTDSLAQTEFNKKSELQTDIQAKYLNNPVTQKLIKTFNTKININSIKETKNV